MLSDHNIADNKREEQYCAQLDAVKGQSEKASATFKSTLEGYRVQLSQLEAERDGLSTRVEELRTQLLCAGNWERGFKGAQARCESAEKERDILIDQMRATAEEEKIRKSKDIKQEFQRQDRSTWKKATNTEAERCLQRDMRDWKEDRWTPKMALQRFHAVSNEFLTASYTKEKRPLTWGSVPWPVLHRPQDITRDSDNITWESVEKFLGYAQIAYGSDVGGYQNLVKQIQMMFHMDRWKNRGLFKTVMDKELRSSLDDVGNIVSQAVNQWKTARRL